MLIKILSLVFNALSNYIPLIDSKNIPKRLRPCLKPAARLSVLTALTLGITYVHWDHTQLETKKGNAVFYKLLSANNVMHTLDHFNFGDNLHLEDSDTYSPKKVDLAEIELQKARITNELNAEAVFLEDDQYQGMRSLEYLLDRVVLKGADMDSKTALAQMRSIAQSVIAICGTLDTSEFGYEGLCRSAREHYAKGGTWPKFKAKRLNKDPIPVELSVQYSA